MIVMIVSDTIKKALMREGASLVGITEASPLPVVGEVIKRQWEAGNLAEMKWLSLGHEQRVNPEKHLEGARSIICSAWPYSSPGDCKYVARYAQHHDYHDYIKEKLRAAWDAVIGKKARALFFVDSRPIAEKAYAEKAGLGWIGKNALLINKGHGSLFCLGLILTDMAMDYDKACRNNCGDCVLCMNVCPAGALVAPGVIDCRRCISYLTTEHKGDIPLDIRPFLGDHVFGCDICQDACPYNKGLKNRGAIPERELGVGSLNELMLLDDAAFAKKFEGTPIYRIGRSRFLRNVSVALGNLKSGDSIPFLSRGLQDDDILIRNHSTWALGQILDGNIEDKGD